jgi:V8-like Glu-specific endopeptidase
VVAVVAVVAALGASVGCDVPHDEVAPGTGVDRRPIVGGTRENGEDAVIAIIHESGGMCSGSVIAPRVVITAKHCVIDMYGSGAQLSARGFHVFVGPGQWSFFDEYRVTEVRRTPGTGLDNSDFALLILDRDFEHGALRWEFEPLESMRPFARITAIGYGQTRFNDSSSAGNKYRRDGQVAAVGPNAMWRLGDREFMSDGENTCQGDSGGPLIHDGFVVGIVSRGEEGCEGYGWVTRVSGFADLIRAALVDTGACVPSSFEVCNGADDDCFGGADDGLGESCGCADGGAAREEICDRVDNDCDGEVDDLEACACTGGGEPEDEVCDRTDNDCDGELDEGCVALGEPCGGADECSAGLCAEIDGERVCTAECVAGGAPCPEGGYCDARECDEGLCRPATGDLRLGRSCESHAECESRFCARVADGAHRCTRPCEPSGSDCFATELCLTLDGGCGACSTHGGGGAESLEFGDACRGDDECESGQCLIDGDEDECREGCTHRYCTESCVEDGVCPEGAHCRGDVCVRGPHSAAGETCVDDLDCAEGSCTTWDGGRRCTPGCGDGGTCPDGAECVEGYVCWPAGVQIGDACDEEGAGCGDGGRCTEVVGDTVCVESCSTTADCPSGLSCISWGRDGRCVPYSVQVVTSGDDSDDGGCQCAASADPRSRAPVAALLLALVVLVACRSRRRG